MNLQRTSIPRLGLCGLLLGLSLALTSGAQAHTWTVEKDGSGDFTIIQEALDAAAAGDTIRIGVGRFDDFSYSGTSRLMTIGRVRVPDLVVIGVSPEATILGPETRIPDTSDAEYTILRLEPGTGAVIEDLSIVNSRVGLNISGQVTLTNALVAGHWAGIFDGSAEPLVVRNSHFEDCTNYGVISGPEGSEMTVEDCTFHDCEASVYFLGIETGIVRRCNFSADLYQRTFIMVTAGSYAVIEDCHFLESPESHGVDVTNARAVINNNWFGMGWVNVTARNSGYFEGSGNVLRGGTSSSVRLMGFNSGASFHGNDIYNPVGATVHLLGYQTAPTKPLDLTNNWWGTVDSDSIEAGFMYENSNPELFELLWQPFRTQPVPVETTSSGGLKSLFRRR